MCPNTDIKLSRAISSDLEESGSMSNKISSHSEVEDSEEADWNISAAATEKNASITEEQQESQDNSDLEEIYNDNSIDVTHQDISISQPSMIEMTRMPTLSPYQNNEVLDDLRRSFDSSLIFDTQNHSKMNQILEKRESFSQYKPKKRNVQQNSNIRNEENV